jgi:hypothetical protein
MFEGSSDRQQMDRRLDAISRHLAERVARLAFLYRIVVVDLRAAWCMLKGFDYRTSIEGYHAGALWVAGSCGNLGRDLQNAFNLPSLPNAEVATIDGAGHTTLFLENARYAGSWASDRGERRDPCAARLDTAARVQSRDPRAGTARGMGFCGRWQAAWERPSRSIWNQALGACFVSANAAAA